MGTELQPYRSGESGELEVGLRGSALLRHPFLNKGSAFSVEERVAFGLEGRLPHVTSTIEQQMRRVYSGVCGKGDDLEKYVELAALQDRNEHLFYSLILSHLEELMPIIYTPTVGRACQEYSHIFRRGRGLWITPAHRGRIAEILRSATVGEVRLVCVTDNERILGLGDQGAGGMGIPIGKLALYTVAAGVHPAESLPVSLDVGTNNSALRGDPLYLGWREPRLVGEAYETLVDEFVNAVREVFPRALLQWEDFKKGNAIRLLDRYRQALPSFNDDIEGTAAVALAGIYAAGRATGTPIDAQRVVILGAGAAGVGIGRQLRRAFEQAGVSGDALIRKIAVLDSRGLLVGTQRETYKQEFSWPPELVRRVGLDPDGDRSLASVVRALRPSVLIGASGQPGAFDETVVRAMATSCERPVIFPFSNPTAKSEAVPVDLMQWTEGRALVATGSPFPDVEQGAERVKIAQGNNVYVFPGVGLGVLVCEARELNDALFTVAAETLASQVAAADLERGLLYPPIADLRELTRRIGVAVAREARAQGLARRELLDAEVEQAVAAAMWSPDYPRLVPMPG